MAIQSDETLVTKGDLKTLYTDKILPYLGGNMMMQTGVSDYYSEDEKVVGVWTDGKPVYQKTVQLSAMTSAVTMYQMTDLGISNIDKPLFLEGFMINSTGWKLASPFWQTTSDFMVMSLFNEQIRICSPSWSTYTSGYATIKYTKTTDTASAALTTPGCYDLNRPDLWPENKEIFFGNGLYGYRATGNMPALAAGTDWTNIRMLTNIGTNGKTFQMGGGFETLNANQVRAWTQLGISRSGNFESTLVVSTNGELQIGVKFPGASHHSTTANKYDVWVTYTK